jgi:hypothetical protein
VGANAEGHMVIAGDRQDIPDSLGLQRSAQLGVGAVDLVAGHPSHRDPGVQRANDHRLRQGGLGRKPDLVGDTGGLQARRVVQPALGQVQLPVDHRVPRIGGVHQVHGDLGILDPAGGAGVLALDPDGGGALLEVTGLVDDQHRLVLAQVFGDIVADVIADRVVVPHRSGEQVLHPVRAGVAGVLGDRPAVLAGQVRKQPTHERPGPLPQIHPSEPTRNPIHQLVERLLPAGRIDVYAVACGHRLISGCPHNTR